jgi:hypothetical protein
MATVTKHGNMPAAKIEGTDAEFGPSIGVPEAGPAMMKEPETNCGAISTGRVRPNLRS